MHESSPQRRWVPRPLVILLLALILVVLTSIISVCFYAQRRLAAFAYVESSNGDLILERPAWCPEKYSVPRWLMVPEHIELTQCRCDLRQLRVLRDLRTLGCSFCEMDREGLRSLTAFPELERLEVRYSHISDVDLLIVKKCRNLKWLALSGCPVTDAGMEHLTDLPLEFISLEETGVTDAGLAKLSRCSTLTSLLLGDMDITNEGVKHVAGLPLKVLEVRAGTRVTTDILPIVESIPTLEAVGLGDPPFNNGNTRPLRARGIQVFLYKDEP